MYKNTLETNFTDTLGLKYFFWITTMNIMNNEHKTCEQNAKRLINAAKKVTDRRAHWLMTCDVSL